MNTALIIHPKYLEQPKEEKREVVRNQQDINTGLLSLPDELLLLIMQHTSTKDLHALSAVCLRLNGLAPDELVERALDELNALRPQVNRELSTIRQKVQAVEPRQTPINFLGKKWTVLSKTADTDIAPLQYVGQDLNRRVVISGQKVNSLKAYVLYLKKHLTLKSKQEKIKQFNLVEKEVFKLLENVMATTKQVQTSVRTSITTSIVYPKAIQTIIEFGEAYRNFN